jgi:hypothetical protein
VSYLIYPELYKLLERVREEVRLRREIGRKER